MKTFLSWSATMLMAGAVLISCSKDKDRGPVIPEGNGTVQLSIKEYQMNGVAGRASSGEEDPIAGNEDKLANQIDIVVLNNIRQVEFTGRVSVNTLTGLTSPFTVSNGPKTFFVFSNRPTSGYAWPPVGLVSAVPLSDLVANVGFTGNVPSIAKPAAFAIHTLWDGKEVTIDGTGTVDNPQRVTVQIGRGAAKINLASVAHRRTGLTGTLPGEFNTSAYEYTLKSIPTKYYLRGRYTLPSGVTGVQPPYAGVTYESAVHTDSYTVTASYTNYGMGNPLNTPFYAVENTTRPNALDDDHIYHGNTTYISLKTHYAPNGTEIYSSTSLNVPVGALSEADGSFWIAEYNNSKRLFADDPTGADPGIDNATVTKCKAGIMYYYIPVRDPSEATLAEQCCVIRNHSYTIRVLSISGYGSGEETEKPGVPILPPPHNESYVEVDIEVLKWYKVEHGVDL